MSADLGPVARAIWSGPQDPVAEDADVVAARELSLRAAGQGRPLVLSCDLAAALGDGSDMAGALWCLYEPETVTWHQRLEAAAGADVVVAASATPVRVLADPDGCDPRRLARAAGSIAARTAAPYAMGAVNLEGIDDLAPWHDYVAAMVEGFRSAGVHGLLMTGLSQPVSAEAVALGTEGGLPVVVLLDDPTVGTVARCRDAGAVAVGPAVVGGAGAGGRAAVSVWPAADGPAASPFVDGVSMAGFGADPSPALTARLRSLADQAL